MSTEILLTSLSDVSPVVALICAVLLTLNYGRVGVMLCLVTCATILALVSSGDRADRAARILEVLLDWFGRGGER